MAVNNMKMRERISSATVIETNLWTTKREV